MDRESAIGIVRKYIQNLEKSGISVSKVYLYGSQARNEANEDSDIDVLVVSDAFDDADDIVRSSVWDLTLREDHRIEPYPVGTKRFMDPEIFSPLLEVVKKEGIEVTF